MSVVSVEIPSPLSDCILFCEIVCVLGCCGIDAVSTDPAHFEEWCGQAGSVAVIEARLQLAELIDLVEDRAKHVESTFLNLRTHDEFGRRAFRDFLAVIDAGLTAGDESWPW